MDEFLLGLCGRLGELMDGIRPHLGGRPARHVVEFAARCLSRVRGLETAADGAKNPVVDRLRDEFDDAHWLSLRVAAGGGGSKEAIGPLAWSMGEAWRPFDSLFNELDEQEWDESRAGLLMLGRVTVRYVQSVVEYGRGDEGDVRQKAAACAAYAIAAAGCIRSGDRVEIESAIRRDLEEFPDGDTPFPPLWVGRPPTWHSAPPSSEHPILSKIDKRVINYLMDRAKARKDDRGPEAAGPDRVSLGDSRFPAAETELAAAIIDLRLAETRDRARVVQKEQLRGVQNLLDVLAGQTKVTYQSNRELAEGVTKLVDRVGGVLLFNGEFVDNRGRTKVYINQPVTIRCDDPRQPSFKLRTVGSPAVYVAQSTVWPRLAVASKDW